MAKQLNVSLAFTADTGQAAQQIKQLQQQLDNLTNIRSGAASQLGITKEIQQAINMTNQLKAALNSSLNANTGNLDLGKFHESITKSGLDLQTLQKNFAALGPAGNQAFAGLAKSIATAEIPMRRTNQLLTEMGTTLKNSIRWQLSSSIIHGFMGSVQTAWHYAQNLNESLNNIRIVTGQTTDQMAQFAEQANKAAKSLSTSTLSYTDASLIYYQQGLTDEQVAERTATTIKLANVSRQSAKDVSDQLTAVWNNFDDGSRSLESYVDVMVKLGATTASSSDEIATGLEKFAAVADTVGLSFNYAAAALATVTAATRQSADTVGTAFRTLFARMEGLSLGETLDDGTDLNKYSAALASVGVNIKEANGEIKDMDTILDETAAKWQQLSKDQQVALAQTVGGVRQYTTFISLMDNWADMEKNLTTAAGSAGALQEQADIYAESWEAARKRVQASLEGIYQDLINDKAFIQINNAISTVIDSIGNMVDALGGLDGLLLTIGTVVTRVFSQQIGKSIDNMLYSLNMAFGKGKQELQEMQQSAIQNLMTSNMNRDSTGGAASYDAYASMGRVAQEVYSIQSKLTGEQALGVSYLTQQHDAYAQAVIDAGEELEQEEKITESIERRVKAKIVKAPKGDVDDFNTYTTSLKAVNNEIVKLQGLYTKLDNVDLGKDATNNFSQLRDQLSRMNQELTASGQSLEEVFGGYGAEAIRALQEELNSTEPSAKNVRDAIDNIGLALDNTFLARENIEANMQAAFERMGFSAKEAEEMVNELGSHIEGLSQKQYNLDASNKNLIASEESLKAEFEKIATATMPFGQAISRLASSLMSFGMIYQSITGIIDTLNNDDLSFWEKFMAILPSVSMAMMGLTNVFNAQNLVALQSVKEHGAAALSFLATGTAAQAGSKGIVIFGHAFHLALGPIGKFLLIAGAIATALALIGKAMSDKSDSVKTLEELKEDNEKLQTAFNDTNTAATELLDTIKQYREASTALEDLKVGTDEWKESLAEANNAASLLLANYADIEGFGDFYHIEDGQIKIDQEGLSILEKTAKTSQLNAQLLAGSGDLAVRVQESKINNANSTQNSLTDLGFDLASNSSIGESPDQANQFFTLIDAFMQQFDLYGKTIQKGTSDTLDDLIPGIEEGTFDAVKEILLPIAEANGINDENVIDKVAGNIFSRYNAANPVWDYYLNRDVSSWNQLATSQAAITAGMSSTEQIASSQTTIEQEGLKFLADQFALNDINNTDFAESDWADIISKAVNTVESQTNATERLKAEADWMTNEDALKREILSEMSATYTQDEEGHIINRETGEVLSDEEINSFRDYLLTEGTARDLASYQQIAAKALEELDFGEQSDSIKKILSGNINELTQSEVEAAVEAFDGTEAEALIQNSGLPEEVKATLIDLFTNGFSEAVDNYDPTAYAPTLDTKIVSNFKEAKKVLDDLAQGDEISADDYGKLGEAAQGYFQKMADGTYQLVGDAEALQDALRNDAIKDLEAERNEIQGQIDLANANYRYGDIQIAAQDFSKGIEEGTFTASTDVEHEFARNFIESILGEEAWQKALVDENGSELMGEALSASILAVMQSAIDKLNSEQADLDAIDASETAMKKADVTTMQGLVDNKDLYTDEEYEAKKSEIIESDSSKSDDYNADDIEHYMDVMKELHKATIDNDAEAQQAAESLARWNKAVQTIDKSYDGWVQSLDDCKKKYKENYKESAEYHDAMLEAKDAMADLLDVENDLIDSNFAEEHLDLMKEAAEGSQEAFNELQGELAKEHVTNIEVNTENATYSLDDVSNAIDAVVAEDYEVGINLDDAPAMQALYNIASQAGMTVSEIQDMFNGLGWHPEITVTDMPINDFQEMYQTGNVQVVDPISGEVRTVSVQGAVDMAAGGTIRVVSINGDATYKSASGPQLGGNHSGGGSSGGGGGGGSKKADKPKLKNKDDERKRYHDIQDTLDDLERAYNKVSKARDRAFGKAKVAEMDKEKAAIEAQIKSLKDYQKEQQNYYKKDRKKVNTLGASMGYEFTFDSEGNIDNFDDFQNKAVDFYNQLAQGKTLSSDELKALGISQDDITDDEGKVDAQKLADAWWEKKEQFIDQYEETKELMQDTEEQIQDKVYELQDLALEKLQYQVEINIDVRDRALKVLQFQLDQLDNGAYDAVAAIANLETQLPKIIDISEDKSAPGKVDILRTGIQGILQQGGMSEERAAKVAAGGKISEKEIAKLDLTEDQVAALQDYADQILDANQALVELREEVRDRVLSSFDELADSLTEASEKFDIIQEFMDVFANMNDILGNSFMSGITRDTSRALDDQRMETAAAEVDAKYTRVETLQNALKGAEDSLADAMKRGDEDAQKTWTEAINRLNEQITDAQSDFVQTWQESLEQAREIFEKEQAEILDDYSRAASGMADNLADLQRQFNQRQDADSWYVDDFKKIYELSKLNRDLQNKMDETDNIKAKQTLLKLQDEINERQTAGVEMSQYELDELQKRYELKLAEIALDEAQNAKDTVRMSKDAEGNWSYVYTANEDEMSNAQQNYEDKLYALQELNTNYLNEQQEAYIATQQEMMDAVANIRMEDYHSAAAWQKAVDSTLAYYNAKAQYHMGEVGKAINNNQVLYSEDWQQYSDATGYKISAQEDWADTFEETNYSIVSGFGDAKSAMNVNQAAVERISRENAKNYNRYWKRAQAIMQAARTSLDKTQSHVKGVGAKMSKYFDSAGTHVSQLGGNISALNNISLKDARDVIEGVYTTTDTTKSNIATALFGSTGNPAQTGRGAQSGLNGLLNSLLSGDSVDDSWIFPDFKESTEAAKDNFASVNKKVNSAFEEITNSANDWYKKYSAVIQNYINKNNDLLASIQAINEAKVEPPVTETTDNKEPEEDKTPTDNKPATNSTPTSTDGKYGKEVTWKGNSPYRYFTTSDGKSYHLTGTSANGYSGSDKEAKEIQQAFDRVGYAAVARWTSTGGVLNMKKLGFKTGGYTGDWNSSEGKLAFLHQKELVLNAEDTSNILSAVDMVRQIAEAIDLSAMTQAGGLRSIGYQMPGGNDNSGIQQTVTIQANFPDTTDVTAIKNAFTSLMETASQFANRKKL